MATSEVINNENYSINEIPLTARNNDFTPDAQMYARWKTFRVSIHIKDNNSEWSKTTTKNAELPNLSTDSNVITLPSEVNGHRKVKLNDALLHAKNKRHVNQSMW